MAQPRYVDRVEPTAEATVDISPAYQAYQCLRWGFTVVPLVAGADKYFHFLVDWNQYLAPTIANILSIPVTTLMLAVGVIEILAGVIVALKPVFGGYLVAAWLWAMILNLLLIPGYFDIALRDFGLSLGALALARLARQFKDVEATVGLSVVP